MLIVAATFTGYKILSNHNVEFIDIDEEDSRFKSIELALPEGKTPDDFAMDPKKALYIANGVVSNSSHYESTYTGLADAKVVGINYRQKTITHKKVNDDEAFFEIFSLSSLVKVAEQRYVTDTSYLTRKGKNVYENSATFDNNISSLSTYDLISICAFYIHRGLDENYSIIKAELEEMMVRNNTFDENIKICLCI